MNMARDILGRGTAFIEMSRASRLARDASSSDGNRHHQSAVGDERVTSALESQRRLRADVAVPDLGVVADRLDRLVRVVVRQAELRAEVTRRAEQSLHVGI